MQGNPIRKIKFKAWNVQTRLLMRLDSIECTQGQLSKPGHILLQFTGCLDKYGHELYEMDLVLAGSVKKLIRWSEEENGWIVVTPDESDKQDRLNQSVANDVMRLGNYFEMESKD